MTPLRILSGVGLLIRSTSARIEALHSEVHALRHDPIEREVTPGVPS